MGFQTHTRRHPPVRSLEEYIAHTYGDVVHIDINLRPDYPLFHPLSSHSRRELTDELYGYIDAKLYPIPLKYPITLCFHGDLNAAEQQAVRAALREHYGLILLDKALDLRINLWKLLALSALGVCLLGLWFAAQWEGAQPLFSEILSIAGTFSLWEAVDLWLLERSALKRERRNAAQAAGSAVAFQPSCISPSDSV